MTVGILLIQTVGEHINDYKTTSLYTINDSSTNYWYNETDTTKC